MIFRMWMKNHTEPMHATFLIFNLFTEYYVKAKEREEYGPRIRAYTFHLFVIVYIRSVLHENVNWIANKINVNRYKKNLACLTFDFCWVGNNLLEDLEHKTKAKKTTEPKFLIFKGIFMVCKRKAKWNYILILVYFSTIIPTPKFKWIFYFYSFTYYIFFESSFHLRYASNWFMVHTVIDIRFQIVLAFVYKCFMKSIINGVYTHTHKHTYLGPLAEYYPDVYCVTLYHAVYVRICWPIKLKVNPLKYDNGIAK